MKELEKDPKAILFIDEIHTVIGAGATSGGAMDAKSIKTSPKRYAQMYGIYNLQGVWEPL